MCRRVDCQSCSKPTYAGCGMHIEQVLGNVPTDKRCRCREDAKAAKGDGGAGGGWLRNLFGK